MANWNNMVHNRHGSDSHQLIGEPDTLASKVFPPAPGETLSAPNAPKPIGAPTRFR